MGSLVVYAVTYLLISYLIIYINMYVKMRSIKWLKEYLIVSTICFFIVFLIAKSLYI